jgi:hypothetical protein
MDGDTHISICSAIRGAAPNKNWATDKHKPPLCTLCVCPAYRANLRLPRVFASIMHKKTKTRTARTSFGEIIFPTTCSREKLEKGYCTKSES